MKVHLVRDASVAPGGATWLDLPGEMMFVVSAQEVTQDGTECLEACWAWFVDNGVWRWQERGGRRITAAYHHEAPPNGDIASVTTRPGRVDVWLDPDHFTLTAVEGMQRAVCESVAHGWTWHDVVAHRVAS